MTNQETIPYTIGLTDGDTGTPLQELTVHARLGDAPAATPGDSGEPDPASRLDAADFETRLTAASGAFLDAWESTGPYTPPDADTLTEPVAGPDELVLDLTGGDSGQWRGKLKQLGFHWVRDVTTNFVVESLGMLEERKTGEMWSRTGCDCEVLTPVSTETVKPSFILTSGGVSAHLTFDQLMRYTDIKTA